MMMRRKRKLIEIRKHRDGEEEEGKQQEEE